MHRIVLPNPLGVRLITGCVYSKSALMQVFITAKFLNGMHLFVSCFVEVTALT